MISFALWGKFSFHPRFVCFWFSNSIPSGLPWSLLLFNPFSSSNFWYLHSASNLEFTNFWVVHLQWHLKWKLMNRNLTHLPARQHHEAHLINLKLKLKSYRVTALCENLKEIRIFFVLHLRAARKLKRNKCLVLYACLLVLQERIGRK